LLSGNGRAYISEELKNHLATRGMTQTHGAPYHRMTQGKIERYHRSMKNEVSLQKYYLLWELEQETERFVNYYNNERYHESLNNMTPADGYYGRHQLIISLRERLKRRTLKARKHYNISQTIAQSTP
jgi:transposase InsO family protein